MWRAFADRTRSKRLRGEGASRFRIPFVAYAGSKKKVRPYFLPLAFSLALFGGMLWSDQNPFSLRSVFFKGCGVCLISS
ncbi:hypothetical protein HanHA300_Chr14g0525171 [Helianthus annuus]|nr:hypothetical protein HanHA300_Chr14g0525171 [Helianthus annuus]